MIASGTKRLGNPSAYFFTKGGGDCVLVGALIYE